MPALQLDQKIPSYKVLLHSFLVCAALVLNNRTFYFFDLALIFFPSFKRPNRGKHEARRNSFVFYLPSIYFFDLY